ncbi:MAG TPA: hypothetical protein VMV91_09430 [Rhodocyclaceae bacterium]|nr:hypothetical protein [Rhodocyclaceae bacterium]HUX24247.1 hypothetical protein [Burkholderiales bacterium]
MGEFLKRSAFAAQQGWSASYVTKLGHQGRLVLSSDQKLIDVDMTLAALRRTGDPGKEYMRQHHAAARVEKHVAAHVRPDAASDDERALFADVCTAPKYWDNKTRREGALAELAEIELAKTCGNLVDRQRVEAMAFTAGRMLRDTVLGLPTQLAPVFAGMAGDAFGIEVRMRDALRQVFADAAKMSADDLRKVSEQSQ